MGYEREETVVLKKPVDWDELYPGRFIKFGDLGGRTLTLTIAGVDLEELEGNKGKQVKGILSFEKTPKGLPLNKTNGIGIKSMFGRKLADWSGKRVTIFGTLEGGEECIRIWGSPDIEADMDIIVELPRKKPRKMTMHKVTPGKAAETDRQPGDE